MISVFIVAYLWVQHKYFNGTISLTERKPIEYYYRVLGLQNGATLS